MIERLKFYGTNIFSVLFGLVILFSCLGTTAGPVKVGNGGGFAEMKALWVNSHMDLFWGPCLQGFNSCRLSGEEEQILKKLIQTHSLQMKGGGIGFNAEISEDFSVSEDNRLPVLIHPRLLYREDVALGISLLGKVLLHALGLKAELSLGELGVVDTLGRKLFGDVTETVQSKVIRSGLLHLIHIRRQGLNRWAISLELPDKTLDLTPKIYELMECSFSEVEVKSLRLSTLQGVGLLSAEWICSGNSDQAGIYTGQIVISNVSEIRLIKNSIR